MEASMEEDHEPKHVCKFCSKSFPCGRSLGGHMRSHIINNSSQPDEKLAEMKLSSVNNGYRLRENPKRTWRVANVSVEVLLQDKFCKECGKGFRSWKALFGHMKCHSEKERVANSLEEHQDSWTDENTTQKLVLDRQSDNDLSPPNRRKRSERRTRWVTTSTSALSLADPASSVSDSKHEQEVALSLMMLSRDMGSWGALHSVTESSENDSMNKTATSEITKTTEQQGENEKLGTSDFTENHLEKHSETPASEFSRTILQPQEAQHESGKWKSSGKGYISIKRVFSDLYDCKIRQSNPLNQGLTKVSASDLFSNSQTRSKFVCTTCNKVFSSYQALGGHRASHRRTAAYSGETDFSDKKESPEDTTATALKKNKGHECPICFKVFASGQALGGHKRSHLIAHTGDNRTCATLITPKSVSEVRDFLDLDLNLPASTEEESTSQVSSYSPPWWVSTIHNKHDEIAGVFSS